MAAIALPPPAANNAGFLALYNQVPLATTNQIERDIWELTQIDVRKQLLPKGRSFMVST